MADRSPIQTSARWPWLLPGILWLLAFALVTWEGRRLDVVREGERERRWLDDTQHTAEKLADAARPEFWIGVAAARLQRRIEADLAAQSLTPAAVHPADLGSATARALAQPLINGGDHFHLWAVASSPGADRAKPCLGPRFTTDNRHFFSTLLTEVIQGYRRGGTPLAGTNWASRLRRLLGIAIVPEMFRPPGAGKPIPVIYAQRYGILVWQPIRVRRQTVGAFLMIMPIGRHTENLGLRLTLANWRTQRLVPAFLTLPTEPGQISNTWYLPSSTHRHRPPGSALAQIAGEFSIGSATERNAIAAIRYPAWRVGQVSRLSHTVSDRADRTGLWFARLCPLGGRQQVALLCERMPPLPPSRLDQLQQLWIALGLAFMVCVGGGRALFGPSYSLPLRGKLLAWFVAVVAGPMFLAIGAGALLVEDRRENLINARYRDLRSHLASIDAGTGHVLIQQDAACRRILRDPALPGRLLDIQCGRAPVEALPNNLLREAQAAGLPMRALIVWGTRDFFLYATDGHLADEAVGFLIDMTRGTWAAYLKHLVGVPVAPPRLTLLPGMRQPRTSLVGRSLGVASRRTVLDQVEHLNLSDEPLGTYVTRMGSGVPGTFVVGFVWRQAPAYRRCFQDRIAGPQQDHEFADIAAFETTDGRLRTVAHRGQGKRLAALALGAGASAVRREYTAENTPMLVAAIPSLRLPGCVLAGQVSIAPIYAQIAREMTAMTVQLLAALALVATAALVLSTRLAGPLVRMSRGLTRLAAGDFSVAVAEPRQDELGLAGRTLDAMTANLLERRRLGRFVSADVVRLVSGGNLQQIAGGVSREVTVLASDIRDFTTLSEQWPAPTIFAGLNAHLEAMTPCIQRHGGVIDRYIGDAIVAVFHPGSGRHHAQRAVDAAIDMTRAHADLQAERASVQAFTWRIGIGIDTGPVTLGVLGDPAVRLDFSVVGAPVHHATDLEARSKLGRASRIVVSSNTKNYIDRSIPLLDLPGHGDSWELDISPTSPAVPGAPMPTPAPADPTGNATSETIDTPAIPSGPSPHGVGWRPAAVLVFATFLWALPIAFLLEARNAWRSAQVELERRRTMARLQDDLALLEKIPDGAAAASQLLRSRIAQAQAKARDRHTPTSGFVAAAHDELARLAPLLPGLSVTTAVFQERRSVARAYFSGIDTLLPQRSTGDTPSLIDIDIGSAPTRGRAAFTAKGVFLSSSGADFWDPPDAGHFLGRPVGAGEASWSVCVGGLSDTAEFSKAGLMMRADTRPDAPFVFVNTIPTRGLTVSWRPRRGEAARSVCWLPPVTPAPDGRSGANAPIPTRVSLARQYNEITVSVATAGLGFVAIATVTPDLGPNPLVGLALSAHVNILLQPREARVVAQAGLRPPVDLATWRMLLAFMRASSIMDASLGIRHRRDIDPWVIRCRELFAMPTGAASRWEESDCQLAHFPFAGSEHAVAWFPLWRSARYHRTVSLENTVRQHAPHFRDDPAMMRHQRILEHAFAGLVFVTVPPTTLTPTRGRGLLRTLFRERGAVLTLAREARASTTGSGTTSVFARTDATNQQIVELSDRLGLFARLSHDPTTSVLLERPHAAPGTRWLDRLLLAFLALWTIGGIGLLLDRLVRGTWWSLGLRAQLLGAFVVVIGPMLLLALCLRERAQVENEIRLLATARDLAQRHAERVDDSFRLSRDWARATMAHVAYAPALRQWLRSRTTMVSSMPVDLKRWVEDEAHRRGLNPTTTNLVTCDRDHRVALLPSRTSADDQSDKSPMARLAVYLFRNTVNTLGYGGRPDRRRHEQDERQDLLIGAEFEDMQRTFSLLFGAVRFAEMIMAPSYSGGWITGKGEQERVFRTTLWTGPHPDGSIHIGWINKNHQQHHMQSWMQADTKAQGLFAALQDIRRPQFAFSPPFFESRWSSPDPATRHWLTHNRKFPIGANVAQVAALAARANESLTLDIGLPDAPQYLSALPGRELGGWSVLVEYRLDRLLAAARELTARQRLLLVILLLLTVILALNVAGRVLVPILTFVAAARRAMQGDFACRLPDTGTDELGTLARAFNRMAAEAEEGRLLGRFVSDSVRAVARDGALAVQARQGQERDVVILFASLSHAHAHGDPAFTPSELVHHLNRHLETLSRIVRDHGGEIDKFIGDKLLAVFTPPPDPGPTPIAGAFTTAVAAARAMRRAPAATDDPRWPPLGIGIVSGPVLAGIMGTAAVRLEYTVIGDTVNLASRLCDHAGRLPQGGIVCDAASASQYIGNMATNFRQLATQPIKGKARAVSLFRVCEPDYDPRDDRR